MSSAARLSLATLGVREVARSTEFYKALGFPLSETSIPGEVSFFKTDAPRPTTELTGLSEVAPQCAVVAAEHRCVLDLLKASQTDWIAVRQPASATKLPVERCAWPSAHPLRTGQPSPPPT